MESVLVLSSALWSTQRQKLLERLPSPHIQSENNSLPFSIIHHSITRDNFNTEITQKQAWLLRRPLTTEPVCVTRTGVCVLQCSDKNCDWLASYNVAQDRKHSQSLSNNYPSLHAGCQRANSSVIIPLLPVESDWQRAQYQSHSITLLLAFISSTLSFTMKGTGFHFTLKANVSACSALSPASHSHSVLTTELCNRKLDNFNQFNPVGSTGGSVVHCLNFGAQELKKNLLILARISLYPHPADT